MSDPLSREARRRARRAALQMLYEWEVGGLDLDEVREVYRAMQQTPLDDEEERFATGLLRGTVSRLHEVDALIASQAEHWRLERMALVDRAILRLAVFELLAAPATPRPVVINEAIELAKTFSTDAAVKFVNGMLDGVARRVAEGPPDEVPAPRPETP